jgi:CheY-like chemotaxis protein
MDEATRQRIFEPFFTTKSKTKGTGLGMAVVVAAVEQHAGFVEVESSPGAGTTFSVFLPLVAAPRGQAATHGAGAPNTLSGTETILVVDDDQAVLKTLRRYLEKHGYSVLGASTGEEAIDVFLHAERLDLVVSDVVMPTMGGVALFQTVNERSPGLPFLFCSGLPAGGIAPEILELPHRALLAKPFSEQVLLRKVRQLLDGSERSERATS